MLFQLTKLVFIFFIMIATFCSVVLSQEYKLNLEKSGLCPPALPVTICSKSCQADAHCQGVDKCCPTGCGGSVCSKPVTMKNSHKIEKVGSCPAVPTGRWICSPTCSTDSDCRGSKKCCRNRCGALACQTPDVELVGSVDTAYQPKQPNDTDLPNDNNNYNNSNNNNNNNGFNPGNPFLSNNH